MVFPGNSSNSPAIALSKPWIRAIPSLAEIMVPVSLTSTSRPKFSICFLIIALISSALICIIATSSPCLLRILQGFFDSFKLSFDAAIEKATANFRL